jgi:hypothetical protein
MPSRYAIVKRGRHSGVMLFVLAAGSFNASAQAARFPALAATADLRIDAAAHGLTAASAIAIGPAGQIIVGQSYNGKTIRGFDSTGRPLPWTVPTGSRNAEIAAATSIGWLGNDFVVNDPTFDQFAVVTLAGKVTKSLGVPKIVRPALADRRKYPTISDANPLAVYADRSLLALLSPEGPSMDAPQFDRSVRHLVRVSENGSIIRTVATVPLAHGVETFRGGQLPPVLTRLLPGRLWHVSSSGKRIVVASTKPAGRDSVAVRVTVIGEAADTVVSTTFSLRLQPIPKAVKDSASRARAAMPRGRRGAASPAANSPEVLEFYPPIKSVHVGRDFSVWLETVDAAGVRYLVLDARGAIVGTFTGSPTFHLLEADRSHVWGIEGGANAASAIVRYKVGASK